MKIIKHGKFIPKEIKFICGTCKCEFMALNTEYEYNYLIKSYVMRCPCCGVECASNEKIGWE